MKKIELGLLGPPPEEGRATRGARSGNGCAATWSGRDARQQLSEVMELFQKGSRPGACPTSSDRGAADRRRLQARHARGPRRRRRERSRARGSRRRRTPPATSPAATGTFSTLAASHPAPGRRALPSSELDAVARCGSRGGPGSLVKEVLTYLGQLRHRRCPRRLSALLDEWETELEKNDIDGAAEEEGLAALDRIAAALARQGGPQGWRVLVRHGLSSARSWRHVGAPRRARLGRPVRGARTWSRR